MKIRARRIDWIHHNPGTDREYWGEGLCGFQVEVRGLGELPFPYRASWAVCDECFFKTLEEAQAWCQRKADEMVAKWAELVED